MPAILDTERRLWTQGYERIAGLDEAGRGCLAGPVVAAAVILPPDVSIPAIQDSKSLSEARRDEARETIEAEAISIGVGICSPQEIDELNILWAAMKAMRRAATDCLPAPDFVLVDGNRGPDDLPYPMETLVKGDAKSQSIAAASIIAKTTRDAMMRELHDEHPEYSWHSNVGYPTQAHYDALEQHGPTPYHRQSFRLTRKSS
jgi:ribonuclease HII